MQLDKFTDFALRVLVALAVQKDTRQSVGTIAQTFGLSEHHLSKVASALVRGGFIISERGRTGGLRLAQAPDQISIGAVVRSLRGDHPVAECFGDNQSCRILPACGLREPLRVAQDAFFAALDAYSLADVTKRDVALADLLKV